MFLITIVYGLCRVSFGSVLLPSTYHAPDAEDDERNGENLSHVDGQRGLEGFLYLLGVLNEEAEGEDIGQAEAEVPAGAYLGVLGVGCWVLVLLL